MIQDSRIVYFINDKERISGHLRFYHSLNANVFLLKLIPGIDVAFLEMLLEKYDGVIIESFGVGGFPDYGDHSFYEAIQKGLQAGKIIVMATQVTHEGSDMSVYRVGVRGKEEYGLMESYDMTPEAVVTKLMWASAVAKDRSELEKLFYKTINNDILCK